jgi:hypothetical protein
MGGRFWKWLISSDQGLLLRIGIAIAIFTVLAVIDIRRKGRRSQRWREYLFLFAVAAAAIPYGVVNDLITAAISWEYFYYGKGLRDVLGPETPPAELALRWEAAKMGMKATWSAGLVVGVAFLFANNPRKNRSQLPYRGLIKLILLPLAAAVVCSVLGGWAGYAGLLRGFSQDFERLAAADLLRPRHFMCVWGVHLGAFVGGAVCLVGSVWAILRRRAKVALSRQLGT